MHVFTSDFVEIHSACILLHCMSLTYPYVFTRGGVRVAAVSMWSLCTLDVITAGLS